MGYTEGTWRLKAIILIVVVMWAMYGLQFMFMGGTVTVHSPEAENWTYEERHYCESALSGIEVQTAGGDIFAIIGFIFSFVTFQASPSIPPALSVILTLFMLILTCVLVYIVYTFAYEIVKGLPFT